MGQDMNEFWSMVTSEPKSFTPTPRVHPTIRLRRMITVDPWPTETPLSEL